MKAKKPTVVERYLAGGATEAEAKKFLLKQSALVGLFIGTALLGLSMFTLYSANQRGEVEVSRFLIPVLFAVSLASFPYVAAISYRHMVEKLKRSKADYQKNLGNSPRSEEERLLREKFVRILLIVYIGTGLGVLVFCTIGYLYFNKVEQQEKQRAQMPYEQQRNHSR